ncbi:MAG: diguanylate cyclase [Snowella sp.]|nr:diguanylate cyclase [Snowella sp.]
MRSIINPHDFLILAVDDIPTNLKVLRGILEPIGYELTFAINGLQTLERVERIKPDLILLDLMMPDIDGLQVCERLYQNPLYQDIPIIFLTASQEQHHLVRAFELGAVDYIIKPFQKFELLARIKTHLELKQYRDRLKRQVTQERLMKEITSNILSYSDLQDILDYTVKGIRDLLEADRVAICRSLQPEATVIIAESIREGFPSRLGEILINGQWLKENNALSIHTADHCLQLIEDVNKSTLTPLQSDYFAHWKVKSEAVLPLSHLDKLWGLMIVDYCQYPHHWREEELNPLIQLTQQTAIAIHQSELYQELQQANQELEKLVNLDSLTQIANRRQFDQSISKEWQRLKRKNLPISLILCDVDHFKKYNDHYGHQAGDSCLRQIAQAIAGVVKRSSDLVARYGGEEFVVLLPATGMEGAVHIAEQVQQAVSALKIPHAYGVAEWITVSMGISCQIPAIDTTFEQLITQSDKALYQAKANGRNQFSAIV